MVTEASGSCQTTDVEGRKLRIHRCLTCKQAFVLELLGGVCEDVFEKTLKRHLSYCFCSRHYMGAEFFPENGKEGARAGCFSKASRPGKGVKEDPEEVCARERRGRGTKWPLMVRVCFLKDIEPAKEVSRPAVQRVLNTRAILRTAVHEEPGAAAT